MTLVYNFENVHIFQKYLVYYWLDIFTGVLPTIQLKTI